MSTVNVSECWHSRRISCRSFVAATKSPSALSAWLPATFPGLSLEAGLAVSPSATGQRSAHLVPSLLRWNQRLRKNSTRVVARFGDPTRCIRALWSTVAALTGRAPRVRSPHSWLLLLLLLLSAAS